MMNNKELVFIENNRVVTDSLTVAEVFGKEHKHVVRDIEVQISKLHEAEEHEFV
jgi:Rha family phage regulatory protein